ncbi:ParA family protein [Candidatus Ruthia endofausta]|uniref:ParA family protein n=1 Tax=Candidatus Ruthia endofausta TaxID=2738852 RepID=UPI0030FB76E8
MTTTVNLSGALKAIKKRILLVDTSSQGNATMGCSVDKYNLNILFVSCSVSTTH